MKDQHPASSASGLMRHVLPFMLVLAICLGAFVAYAIKDFQVTGRMPLGKSAPGFAPYDLLRSTVIAALCAALVWAIPHAGFANIDTREAARMKRYGWISAALLLCISLLFWASPVWLNAIGDEDRPVEYASFAMALGASLLFGMAALRSRRTRQPTRAVTALFASMALIQFLIAGEEVSWFQRVLEIDTPDALTANAQRELNFHNFATLEFENVYYVGSFGLLFLAPFLCGPQTQTPLWLRTVSPSPHVAFSCLVMCPVTYQMWNTFPIQMTFWCSLWVLALCAVKRAEFRPTAVFLGVAMCLALALFLALGHRMIRLWDLTEYREFFISVGFFIYGLDVYKRTAP